MQLNRDDLLKAYTGMCLILAEFMLVKFIKKNRHFTETCNT